MTQDNKVSIIVANYNNEKFIAECIESILNQTYKNFELIIVDDYSSDKSRDIINLYKSRDSRIISIYNEINSGPAYSRNQGIKIATGKYIAILDSDDIAMQNRIEVQKRYLDENPEIFLVGGSISMISDTGEELYSTYSVTKPEKIANIIKKPSTKLTNTPAIINSAIMFRNTKEFFYREKILYSEDKDMFFRMLSRQKVSYVD